MAETVALPLPKARRPIGKYIEVVARYVVIAGVAAWLVINLVHDPQQFFSAAVFGISNGALFALLALGYTLVYGIIELINFAHGDLFMLGTLFTAWMVTTVFGQTGVGLAGWLALAASLVLVMAFCATINMSIEFLAYRRLRHAPKLAPLVAAVGMSFVLQFVGLKWNGSVQQSHPSVLPDGKFSLGGVDFYYSYVIAFLITVPILLGVMWLVTKTSLGRAMRAVAQDQDASRLMGVNVNRVISMTFGLGGALAGVAALTYVETIGTTRYDLGFQLGLIAFTAAVVGGIGSLPGAVLGGLLIGLIQGLNEGVKYGAGQAWTQSVVFVILILVLVFRPTGLLGTSLKEKV